MVSLATCRQHIRQSKAYEISTKKADMQFLPIAYILVASIRFHVSGGNEKRVKVREPKQDKRFFSLTTSDSSIAI